MKKKLVSLIELVISWIEAPLSIKLYSLAMMFGIIFVIYAFVEPLESLNSLPNLILLGLAKFFSGLALLLEMYAWATRIKTWQDSSWALRGVLAGVLAMSLAFSAAYASTIVNEVTGAPPSLFPYTIAFLTPLSALAILLMVLMLVYVVVIAQALLVGLQSMVKSVLPTVMPRFKGGSALWLHLVIYMRILGVVTLVSGILQLIPWYESGLKSVGWVFAARYEMYAHDPCVIPGAEEHIIRRDDDSVLVVSNRQAFMTPFERRRCAKDHGLPSTAAK